MGRIDVELSDELEKKLRIKAATVFSGRKGSLHDAVVAAIEAWVGQAPQKARPSVE